MDAHDAASGNGNGHAGNGQPKSNEKESTPSAVGPSGAPVESSKSVEASAGPPEPLVVIDRDPLPRVKITPNQFAFLQALAAEAGNVSAAARRCEQSRNNHANWMNEADDAGNPTPRAIEYRRLVESIETEACDEIEEEIRRRGIKGVEEPVFYQGEVCGHVRKFSDLLLIFRAKALMPERYRERHEVTGAGGKPLHPDRVTVDVNMNFVEALKTLTDEELETHNALTAKLLARAGGSPPPGAN